MIDPVKYNIYKVKDRDGIYKYFGKYYCKDGDPPRRAWIKRVDVLEGMRSCPLEDLRELTEFEKLLYD